MGQIIVENGEPNRIVGQTPKGHDLIITTTPTGFYRIESTGPGAPPALSQEMFTSLALAKRALDGWRRANAGAYAKAATLDRLATQPTLKEQRRLEREAAAMELKNGEVSVDEEDVRE